MLEYAAALFAIALSMTGAFPANRSTRSANDKGPCGCSDNEWSWGCSALASNAVGGPMVMKID